MSLGGQLVEALADYGVDTVVVNKRRKSDDGLPLKVKVNFIDGSGHYFEFSPDVVNNYDFVVKFITDELTRRDT